MKKLIKVLFACLAIFAASASLKAEKSPVGMWKFESESGYSFPGVTNIVKIVSEDGTFQVLWSYNGGESYILKQAGTWRKIADGVILENPTFVKTGSAIVTYTVKKGVLKLSFSYPSAPQDARVQTYTKIKSLPTK